MLQNSSISLAGMECLNFSQPWLGDLQLESPIKLHSHLGSGSGGYSYHILKTAAFHLFGITNPDIKFRNLR